MRVSIKFFVTIIGLFLFFSSAISLYFALGATQFLPLLLVSAVNIFAVIFLVFLITRGIVSPLFKIQQTVQKVGRGDLGSSISLHSVKELEDLADELNLMIRNTKKAKEAVEEAKATLEVRVQARTKELKELADSLEQNVQDRTKALQEKIQEMERFQKLAVGRELQMIELKKQVEELKSNSKHT